MRSEVRALFTQAHLVYGEGITVPHMKVVASQLGDVLAGAALYMERVE